MKVGFTGTRNGLTDSQREALVVVTLDMTEGSHGACAGSDREFHDLFPLVRMRILPSNESQYQWALAHCEGRKDVIYDIEPPLVRNRRIVDRVERMIAAPKGFREQFRGSGTWAAIRYARQIKKPLIILWPDGRISREFM